MEQEFELIAKTFMGLEPVLAEELTQLGANNVQIGRRMVSFTGDKEMMYRANFQLHTAIRILKPIKHFKARSAEEVYDQIQKIKWDDILDVKKSIFRDDAAVVAVGSVALRWQVLSFPLVASIVLTNMLMQTIRKPLRANIVAAARSGLFFIPLIFILPYFFGLLGVEMCQMWADCCSFAVAVPIAWSAFRDMRREKMELGKSH